MVQHFTFSSSFSLDSVSQYFCLISLKLRFVEVDKGFLHDLIAFDVHFVSYMFW